jgi:hypothetical protein
MTIITFNGKTSGTNETSELKILHVQPIRHEAPVDNSPPLPPPPPPRQSSRIKGKLTI